MKVATLRAGDGTAFDFANAVYERYKTGVDFSDAVRDELADRAIDRYGKHITAAMREKGFDIADGERVTLEVLARAVRERTGLELVDLTPDGVAAAVDALLARKLSAALGVEVTSVKDADDLKQSVLDGARAAIDSGRENALVTRGVIARVRTAATWARSGIAPDDRKRWLARWYQKKFRRSHIDKWIQ